MNKENRNNVLLSITRST